MIKIVIICKPIASSVIRRINVNQFNFSGKFLFQRMKGKQIVSLYNQIICDCTFFIAVKGFQYLSRAFFVFVCLVSLCITKSLWCKKIVNFVVGKGFIIENFTAFCLFFYKIICFFVPFKIFIKSVFFCLSAF